jgi:hypothetical protein
LFEHAGWEHERDFFVHFLIDYETSRQFNEPCPAVFDCFGCMEINAQELDYSILWQI